MKGIRRFVLIFALVLMSVISAFAQGKTTLRIIQYAGGGVDFWEAIDKSFMKEFPSIKVEQEIVQPGQYHQKLGGYVSTGKGPDLALMEAGTSTFMYSDVLVDLKGKFDDILKNVTGYNIYFNDFNPSQPLLAIPTATNAHMMYYNKAVFKAAGLDPENPPKTFKEMDAAVKKIRAINKEGIALGAREHGMFWLYSQIANQVMDLKQQGDIWLGKQSWTKGELNNVIKVLEYMWKHDWINKNAANTSVSPEAQDMFINGEAGFFCSLIGDAFNWKVWGDAMGYENVGVMTFPQLEKGDIAGANPSPLGNVMPLWGSYAFGILKWSKNQDAAVTYLKYLLRPDVQRRFVIEGGFFPNNLKQFDAASVPIEQFQILYDWAKKSVNFPALFYHKPREWDALTRNSQLFFSDKITSAQFAAEMEKARTQK